MIKKISFIVVAILIFATTICLVGCADDIDYANMKLESTSEIGDDSLPVLCGYKAETSEFSIDDVTLTFGLGDTFHGGIDYVQEYINVPFVDLVFSSVSNYEAENTEDRIETVHYIKRIDEDFVSEKFSITESTDWFPYTEEITIPRKMFTGEYGYIDFSMFTDETIVENGYNGAPIISWIRMYYKTDGVKVFLSNEEIK